MARKTLEPADIMALVDTREQAPLDLLLPSEVATLTCGDYSVKGLEHLIAVERKSLPDLVACCGRERDRFERCLTLMRGYETRALIIEASWAEIEAGDWRSHLKPSQVKASLYSWMKLMSVIVAGDRAHAAQVVSGVLFSAARQRWRELQSFYDNLKIGSEPCRLNHLNQDA